MQGGPLPMGGGFPFCGGWVREAAATHRKRGSFPSSAVGRMRETLVTSSSLLPFLAVVTAMLRPGMTGQNRRTQGALVAHPLLQERYTGVEMDLGTFYEIFSLKPSLSK